MGVRYEWMHNPVVQAVEAGSLVGEHETATDALVICADEGTVIEGDLEAFARAVVAAVVRLGGQLVLNDPGPYVPGSVGETDEAGFMVWRARVDDEPLADVDTDALAAHYVAVDVADHPFVATELVPGYCKRCGCAAFVHPVVERCPHGRSVESRRDNPCPPGLAGCEPTTNGG